MKISVKTGYEIGQSLGYGDNRGHTSPNYDGLHEMYFSGLIKLLRQNAVLSDPY